MLVSLEGSRVLTLAKVSGPETQTKVSGVLGGSEEGWDTKGINSLYSDLPPQCGRLRPHGSLGEVETLV